MYLTHLPGTQSSALHLPSRPLCVCPSAGPLLLPVLGLKVKGWWLIFPSWNNHPDSQLKIPCCRRYRAAWNSCSQLCPFSLEVLSPHNIRGSTWACGKTCPPMFVVHMWGGGCLSQRPSEVQYRCCICQPIFGACSAPPSATQQMEASALAVVGMQQQLKMRLHIPKSQTSLQRINQGLIKFKNRNKPNIFMHWTLGKAFWVGTLLVTLPEDFKTASCLTNRCCLWNLYRISRWLCIQHGH